MGVENAEDAATWKPNNRILRRQKKLLPLPKEEMEGEEEDTISIIILCQLRFSRCCVDIAVPFLFTSQHSSQRHEAIKATRKTGVRGGGFYVRSISHFKNGDH